MSGARIALATGTSVDMAEYWVAFARARQTWMSFNCGSWENALARREEMLAEAYDHPTVPATDTAARMESLKADLLYALRELSCVRGNRLPVMLAANTRVWVGLAGALGNQSPREAETVLTPGNADRAYRILADAMAKASVVTSLHGAETWLRGHGRPCPSNTDLTWIAISELNERRAGGLVPRVLVLPNFHRPYNPLLVHADALTIGDEATAEFLRILFSR